MSDDFHDHESSDHDFHDHTLDPNGDHGPCVVDPEPALPGLEYDLPPHGGVVRDLIADPPHPVNWNLLTADEAQTEWLELNRWVSWLRHTYGLPASVIPPLWHRHPELVWELSALHLHWLCAYDPQALGTAPSGWHREFAETRHRLREWVASCGTRPDRDRPTPQAVWPGEQADPATGPVAIANRDQDFARFLERDIVRRRKSEDAFYAQVAELADQDLRDELRS